MTSLFAGRARAFAPLLLGLLWGFNWPAVKMMLMELPPWTARFAGLASSSLVLFAIASLSGASLRIARGDWAALFFAALFTIAGMNIFVAFAQIGAPTSRVTILTFTMPIWTTLIAIPVLGERLDARRAMGLALGICGLVALSLPLIRAGQWSASLGFALAAGLSWAIGGVLSKRWPVSAPSFAIAAWQLAIGATIAGAGMLIFEGIPKSLPREPRTWAALAYHVVLAQALAYTLWFGIIARTSASAAAIGALIVPAVGFASSLALLGERPTLADTAGLVLIIAAAASVSWPGRRRAAAAS